MPSRPIRLPLQGMSKEATLARMQSMRDKDVRFREGKVFSLVYSAGEEAIDLLKQAYTMFLSENGLNPAAFPSLRRFETDVVAMAASLLGGDGRVAGNMTTGGTESIAMAVLTARQWARSKRPSIRAPEMIVPVTAHPAFEKAGHYFDVKSVHVPVERDLRASAAAAEAAMNENTILVVGSAPAYPHGVVDPIRELARAAQARGVLMHVDACVGGFMLPFVRKLGRRVPDFDFSVPGVTSISADLHKYAYAAKGASLILYKDAELRRHQLFAYTDWPGGIYASPTMGGTRPGGAIAAAWAIFHHLGEEGYLAIAREVMDTTDRLRRGINAIPGLRVLGDPVMSVLAIASDDIDIYEVGDEMGIRGWHLDRQQLPPSLHLTINRAHVGKAGAFLDDLATSARLARAPSAHRLGSAVALAAARAATRMLPEDMVTRLTARASTMVGTKGAALPARSAAMYGMMGSLPNRGDLKEMVLDLIERFTVPQEGEEER